MFCRGLSPLGYLIFLWVLFTYFPRVQWAALARGGEGSEGGNKLTLCVCVVRAGIGKWAEREAHGTEVGLVLRREFSRLSKFS